MRGKFKEKVREIVGKSVEIDRDFVGKLLAENDIDTLRAYSMFVVVGDIFTSRKWAEFWGKSEEKARKMRGKFKEKVREIVGKSVDDEKTTKTPKNKPEKKLKIEENIEKISPNKQTSINIDDFEAFWAVYPKKIGKLAAKKAFGNALKQLPPIDELIIAVNKYANCKLVADGYVANPSTWLNQGRWLDDPTEGTKGEKLYKEGKISKLGIRLMERKERLMGPEYDNRGNYVGL